MKITILGTGSIYSRSTCAGILIDDDTLVDIGPGVVKALLKDNFNLSNIKTIFFTHLHSDHISDIIILMDNLEAMDSNHKIDIYGPRGTEDKILRIVHALDNRQTDAFIRQYLRFHEIKDGWQGKFGHHTIEAFSVIHGDIEAYAFRIDSSLGITGDSAMCENIKHLANNCDILICDCSKEVGDEQHMGLNDLVTTMNLNPDLKIIPTHFRDETREKLRAMHLPGIPITEDGYTFNI